MRVKALLWLSPCRGNDRCWQMADKHSQYLRIEKEKNGNRASIYEMSSSVSSADHEGGTHHIVRMRSNPQEADSLFNRLFVRSDGLSRQLSAPLADERRQYLAKCEEQGM